MYTPLYVKSNYTFLSSLVKLEPAKVVYISSDINGVIGAVILASVFKTS